MSQTSELSRAKTNNMANKRTKSKSKPKNHHQTPVLASAIVEVFRCSERCGVVKM